ncbi:unnamed protein product [Amoebophrya sp. A120]|nr:unnamed protein product [Amoebophrya sp. A120]|eukprot:GSA120T00004820001.1
MVVEAEAPAVKESAAAARRRRKKAAQQKESNKNRGGATTAVRKNKKKKNNYWDKKQYGDNYAYSGWTGGRGKSYSTSTSKNGTNSAATGPHAPTSSTAWSTEHQSQAEPMQNKPPQFANVQADDHCETPKVAYEDVAGLLDAYVDWRNSSTMRRATSENACSPSLAGDNCSSSSSTSSSSKPSTQKLTRAGLRLYDPYFCTGKMKTHLANLGFHDVYNEPVNCYSQWKEETTRKSLIDSFDVLITNPPYSGDHLLKLLDFCRKKCKVAPAKAAEAAAVVPPSSATRGPPEQSEGANKKRTTAEILDNESQPLQENVGTTSVKNTSEDGDAHPPLLPYNGKLFLLCLPNHYYIKYANLCREMRYVVPSTRYSYARYFGSSAKTAPFSSLWYVFADQAFFDFLDDRMLNQPLRKPPSTVPFAKAQPTAGPTSGGTSSAAATMSFAEQLLMADNEEDADAGEKEDGKSIPRCGQNCASMSFQLVTADKIPDLWKCDEDPTKKYVKKEKNSKGLQVFAKCGQTLGNCKHTRGVELNNSTAESLPPGALQKEEKQARMTKEKGAVTVTDDKEAPLVAAENTGDSAKKKKKKRKVVGS